MKKIHYVVGLLFLTLGIAWAASTIHVPINGSYTKTASRIQIPTQFVPTVVAGGLPYDAIVQSVTGDASGNVTINGEIVQLVSVDGFTVSVLRGQEGTNPAPINSTSRTRYNFYVQAQLTSTCTNTPTDTPTNTPTPTITRTPTPTPTITPTNTPSNTPTTTPIAHSTVAPVFTSTPVAVFISNPGTKTTTFWSFTPQGTNPWLNTGDPSYTPVSGGVTVWFPDSRLWGWAINDAP